MTPFEIRFVVGGSLKIEPPDGDNLPDLSFDGDALVRQFKEGLTRMLADELVHDGASLSLDITAVCIPTEQKLVVPT